MLTQFTTSCYLAPTYILFLVLPKNTTDTALNSKKIAPKWCAKNAQKHAKLRKILQKNSYKHKKFAQRE